MVPSHDHQCVLSGSLVIQDADTGTWSTCFFDSTSSDLCAASMAAPLREVNHGTGGGSSSGNSSNHSSITTKETNRTDPKGKESTSSIQSLRNCERSTLSSH